MTTIITNRKWDQIYIFEIVYSLISSGSIIHIVFLVFTCRSLKYFSISSNSKNNGYYYHQDGLVNLQNAQLEPFTVTKVIIWSQKYRCWRFCLITPGFCITVVYLSSFELAGLEMMIHIYSCSHLTLKTLIEYTKQLTWGNKESRETEETKKKFPL